MTALFQPGWFKVYSEGLANIYLTITDEAILTAKTDTPSNKLYKARVVNASGFSIRWAPNIWVWDSSAGQFAAYGELQIDNYDGFFTDLIGKNLRDTKVTIRLPRAMAFGSATLIADAMLIATCVIDQVTCDNEDIITIQLKDCMAELDRPMKCKFFDPWLDSNVAGRAIPMVIGTFRNHAPPCIDKENLIFQFSDGNIPNLLAVKDIGINLDRNSTPPDFVPALSGRGCQLARDPQGKITADGSSYGDQEAIPGDVDVLDGDGAFATWAGSPSVPDGWDFSNHTDSVLTQQTVPLHAPLLLSAIPWFPSSNKFGDWLVSEDAILKAGKSYRLSCKIYSTYGAPPFFQNGLVGGIMFRHAVSTPSGNPLDAISSNSQPLHVPTAGDQVEQFEFSVPPGADRKFFIHAVASAGGPSADAGTGLGGGTPYEVVIEELGQYQELPATKITFKNYCRGLMAREGKLISEVYVDADLQAIDDELGYTFGVCATEQPNLLAMMDAPLPSFLATRHSDYLGRYRVRMLTDPKLGTVKAAFSGKNVQRPISIRPDEARNLTTRVGARHNISPFNDESEFSTDQLLVPQDVKERYMRTSQYELTAVRRPAGMYSFAIGAAVFDSLLDDPVEAQAFIERVVGLWGPDTYPDGTSRSGMRRFVVYGAQFDDPSKLGVGTTCAINDILFNDVHSLTYPRHGFDDTRVAVAAWEIFPFAQRVLLTGWY